MKSFFLTFSICICSVVLFSQNKYTISGKISGLDNPSKIVLSYSLGDQRHDDSVVLENSVFKFEGQIGDPVIAVLILSPISGNTGSPEAKSSVVFQLESGMITVEASTSLKGAMIKGGPTQTDFIEYNKLTEPFKNQLQALAQKRNAFRAEGNEAATAAAIHQFDSVREEMNKTTDAFIMSHSDSYLSLQLVSMKTAVIDLKTIEPLYNGLSQRMRETEQGKRIGLNIDIARKTAIGQKAMDFTQANVEGNLVSLSSLKGKYVLVDFWASWCKPCRVENPNLVKAYAKLKDKNFEILSVSLDDKKDAWVKAIEKDGLIWSHVSDLKGWNNEVAVNYGIKAVPQNLLIDPTGTIVAKNLKAEELEKKITELAAN